MRLIRVERESVKCHGLLSEFMRDVLFCIKHKLASWMSQIRGSRKANVHRSLMFHSVHMDGTNTQGIYGISLSRLGELVQELKKMEIRFQRFEEAFEGNDSSVSLTFDDGHKDNFSLAFPMMIQAEVPFTIFVVSDFIGKKGYLNEKEIQELSQSSLVTIGTHGKTHQPLTDLSLQEAQKELSESKRRLELLIHQPVEVMSFPHGKFNPSLVQMAQDLGYKKIGTSVAQANEDGLGPLVNRQCIYSCDTRFTLRQKMMGLWDWIW